MEENVVENNNQTVATNGAEDLQLTKLRLDIKIHNHIAEMKAQKQEILSLITYMASAYPDYLDNFIQYMSLILKSEDSMNEYFSYLQAIQENLY